MKIQLEVNVSSATCRASLAELLRQFKAMQQTYPDWQMKGKITGKEAEDRLFRQQVAVQLMTELAQRVAEEEQATARFGDQE